MDNKMITKKCSSCRKNKDISLFIKNGKELATCKKCLDTCKEYRKNNFEILKIRKKEYHNRNLKKEKARKHKYYLNNHDKLKKQQDKYYSIPKNREKLSKYKNNKEEISEDRKIKYRLDIRRSLLCGAKGRAKKFNLPFSITIDDIIIPEKCPVFNIPMKIGDGKTNNNSPSLDRIIPSLGYTPGNIAVICHRANAIKRNATAEELLAVAEYIKKYTIDKKEK